MSLASSMFIKSSPNLYLPVQLFESVHLGAYDLEFIKSYVKISIKLEIENLAANQYNREAFSNDEINASKRILNLVGKYQKMLEESWKDYRWLIEAINTAREKDKPHANQTANQAILLADIKMFIRNINNNKQKIKFLNCCKCFLDKFDFDAKPSETYSKKDIYNQISMLPSQTMTTKPYNYELAYDEALKNFICNCKNSINRNSKLLLLNAAGLSRDGNSNINYHHIDSIQIDDYDNDREDTDDNDMGDISEAGGLKVSEFSGDYVSPNVDHRNSWSGFSLNSDSTASSSANWRKSIPYNDVDAIVSDLRNKSPSDFNNNSQKEYAAVKDLNDLVRKSPEKKLGSITTTTNNNSNTSNSNNDKNAHNLVSSSKI